MKFTPIKLKGVYIIEMEPHIDHRGFFSRSFCSREFEKIGLESNMVQSNISFSKEKYTLRGMHFQKNGFEEAKLIRCIKGEIQDTIIDLRPESETYMETFSLTLNDINNQIIYVPKKFAHGFITLTENSEVFYQVSAYYNQQNEAGIRWNDPSFNFDWPTQNPIISEKDNNHPDYCNNK
jgi:dTDP-4-dehydrorhamnose 3,5-epimerase